VDFWYAEQFDAVARFAEKQASTDLMRAADALAIRHPVLALLASGLALLVEWRIGKDGR
jgi:hypothetical protein